MSAALVAQIVAAAGQPVAGHTLGVDEMRRAVAEGRVIGISYWSTMGDGEASFGFATSFGADNDGTVHPTYLVFPRPIPRSLRGHSDAEWQTVGHVYAAFGVSPESRTS
jgi:hypothetical protein